MQVGQQAIQQQGGVGLDFGSKLFQLKPATIVINQPNTQVQGATPGKLRITETGDQYDEMIVTLLTMPEERRDYYIGEAGQLNRSPENLMCFSRDMERPHPKAKAPQAMSCATCPKASWEKWRQTKRKEDIPACDAHYLGLFIDTVYQLPMRMFVRSKGKDPFERGMQELARKFKLLQTDRQRNGQPLPDIWDIRFKLSTEKITTGKLASYVPKLSEFKIVTDEEREKFGQIYQEYTSRGKKLADKSAETEAAAQIDTIDAELVPAGSESSNVIEGEIVI